MATPDPTGTFDASRGELRLDKLLAEYVEGVEAGNLPDREALLAANPDLADELREFFANRDGIEHAMGAVRRPSLPPGVLPTLRYFGDYELLEEIARGGMGIVYKARQTSLNRIVAVKMILAGQLATADDVRRFRTEAEAAANLQHANIVAVHEVGIHEGQHYFSMEFVEGQDLAALVRENPLPARRAAQYVETIAGAVHYAHQQGTLHRDLKPSNVLIDTRDQVRITDFGLATRVTGDHTLTQTGQVLGTPSYMAPEQAAGKRGLVGPAADVYSLGVILYELLTGRPPFRAESAVETLHQVMHVEPASPRLLNPHIPRDLETICLKCLEKEPHKRYGTAELLADDLRRYLAGEPILARPVGPLGRAWRWGRRKPMVAGLTLAVALLVLTVAVVSSVSSVYLKRQRDTVSLQKSEIEEQAREIQRESDRANDRLWVSLLETARAMRMSRHSGQHFASLRAIQDALKLPVPAGRSLDELRTEAIGCLLVPDLEAGATWDGLPHGFGGFAIDDAFDRYAYGDKEGNISIRRLSDGKELFRLADVGRIGDYFSLLFSPDGRFLFHRGERNAKLWRSRRHAC